MEECGPEGLNVLGLFQFRGSACFLCFDYRFFSSVRYAVFVTWRRGYEVREFLRVVGGLFGVLCVLDLFCCCGLVFKRRKVALNYVSGDHSVYVDPVGGDLVRFFFVFVWRHLYCVLECPICVVELFAR